jgi:hypothetical protein
VVAIVGYAWTRWRSCSGCWPCSARLPCAADRWRRSPLLSTVCCCVLVLSTAVCGRDALMAAGPFTELCSLTRKGGLVRPGCVVQHCTHAPVRPARMRLFVSIVPHCNMHSFTRCRPCFSCMA